MGEKMETEKKKDKVLIVSYNRIEGFPLGKYEDDSVVVFSGREGGELTTRVVCEVGLDFFYFGKMERVDAAHKSLQEICGDIGQYAVVYSGDEGAENSFTGRFAYFLSRGLGKIVRLVGCKCGDLSGKERMARMIGPEYQLCECRGEKTMGQIAREYGGNPEQKKQAEQIWYNDEPDY